MGSYMRDPALQLPATALLRHTCRASAIPWVAETQVQTLGAFYPGLATNLLLPHSHAYSMCFGVLFFL